MPDLVGKRFGKLVVVKFDVIFKRNSFWICKCDCGNLRPISSIDLKRGGTKSCGCLRKEMLSKRRGKNLTNQKFGNLIVLKTFFKNREGYCLCRCICGNERTFQSSTLKSGSAKSCGCLSESYLASELKKYYVKNHKAKKEYRILKNPKNGYWLPYDIYIPLGIDSKINGIYIEVHGQQHYVFVKYYHKTEEKFKHCKKLDRMKRKYARKNGTYIEIDLRKIKTTEQAIEYIRKEFNKHDINS